VADRGDHPALARIALEAADFFTVADAIGPEGWEPADRSAVSRMYYGLHHEAREFLTRRSGVTNFTGGWDPLRQRQLGAHEYVIALLQAVDTPVADRLDRLRGLRVRADYLLDERWDPGIRSEVRAEVRLIRQFFGTA
jgi:hypothetical protein